LRADFHMHTHFSKDCTTSPQRLVDRCLKVGLGCIAVTDHNTIRGGMEVAAIAPFPVIVASEIKTTHGEITGLFLTEEIPRGLSPMETVERIKSQGGLVSIPHPFDKVRSSVITDDALEEVLPHADIIEAFNARNVFRGADERARVAASTHGLVMTAVSDAHHALELGRTYTEMPEFDGSPAGFLAALKEASLHPSPPPWWGQVLMHGITTFNKGLRRVAPWTRRG
jgi:predicted metal-dependent phosphoesterase TrpH